jgi:quinol monooxygenase YgiN
MGRVLYLATFRVRESHREAFLEAARSKLKPYWESHGVERFEVWNEVGPTGPTGRITQACTFADRDAYLAMQRLDDPAAPVEAYRWLSDPEFRVLELLVP